MRNFVECCIGGDPILPDMTLSGRRAIESEDVLFVCTDGMWATLKDEEICGKLASNGTAMRETLTTLAHLAIARGRRQQRQHLRRSASLAGR